jgi:hypothetical protein
MLYGLLCTDQYDSWYSNDNYCIIHGQSVQGQQSINKSINVVTKLKLGCGNTAVSSSITLVKSQTVQ